MAEFTSIDFSSTDDEALKPEERLVNVGKTSVSTIRIQDLLDEISSLDADLANINAARDRLIDRVTEIVTGLGASGISIPAKKTIS